MKVCRVMDMKDHLGLVVEPSLSLTAPTRRRWPVEVIGNTGTTLMCAGALSLLALGNPDSTAPIFIAGMSCLFIAAVADGLLVGAD
jgi:hypothetical protein